MKQIVVLSGSPRKDGNTDMLVAEFTRGARESGNKVDVIAVRDEHIQPCTGCNFCMSDPEGRCVQKDDMERCMERMSKADVIVAATPLHFYGVTAQLKCLIDRLHTPARKKFKVKKLALLAVGAHPDQIVFEPLISAYHTVRNHFELEDGGVVIASGVREKGEIKGKTALKWAYELGKRI